MDMSIDIKCAITTAILSVLVFLLLVSIFSRVWGEDFGKEMRETDDWVQCLKSMEVVMLVSVFLAYNLNNYLFTSCK